MVSQNRLIFSARFFFDTLRIQLNADKSLVISSATKMKNQHEPIRNVKIGMIIENVAQPPANCKSHATKYPSGVFQLKGNLH